MKKLLFICFMFMMLTACGTEPTRQYNNEDLQDPDCYRHFGAMPGYCNGSHFGRMPR